MIEETNLWDGLCNLCIELMWFMSKETGMSYGMINILLFVILGPVSTHSFCGSSLLFANLKRGKARAILGWSTFAIGVCCMLAVLVLVGWAFLNMPGLL